MRKAKNLTFLLIEKNLKISRIPKVKVIASRKGYKTNK